jgi:ABC-type branched-subunit amino acid transport system ATPase component/ABC-type branched-subunit amino acid transport system permease subunit
MRRFALQQQHRVLLSACIALVALPIALRLLGLTANTASMVVSFSIAAMGLNLLVGYTGLTSFGHSAWFGIGGYAAALAQKHLFPGEIVLPLVLSMIVAAALATAVGTLILRRRGVYFSLLTLALVALTYTIAFRWSEVTGGEDGLGGLERGTLGPINLDNSTAYYAFVAVVGFCVLYGLQRVTRSPFGHVLVAIRENQLRASFQGYPVDRYKLAAFVLSATVTGVGGALLAFQNYFISADATSIAFSGELLAMVVIGGMHHILGPALGALFFVLFRELLSTWTANWLLWFGLVFVGFVLYSPGGLVGIWEKLRRRWRPPSEQAAAMSQRKIRAGVPLPAWLQQGPTSGLVLEVAAVSKQFGGIRAVSEAGLTVHAGEIHALIGPNGAGKTTLFNLVSGFYAPEAGSVRLQGRAVHGLAPDQVSQRGLARSFQITSLFARLAIYENLRLSLQARHAGRFNMWRDADANDTVRAETAELIAFLGLEGMETVASGELSYGGQRLVDLGIALGTKPQILLLDEPLAGLAAAERERVANLIKTIAAHIPVLIVEHDIDRVLGFAHLVTVMNQGQVLMAGTPGEVRADRRVQEIYTGTGAPPPTHGTTGAMRERCVLRADRVNAFYGLSHILNDASLDVREGEILALLGRNGAGKSTLLRTLCGLVRPASGTIEFDERNVAGLPAPDLARMGIGYVPQGRGLFAGMTVADNLALGRLARRSDGSTGFVWHDDQIFAYFPQLRERLHVAADYLSGGEQQMVAVARALAGNVKLLLLDEPFEGLAPNVVLELFKIFDQLREHVPMIIVEHNLDLVLALADRVVALERGTVFHQGPAKPLLEDLAYRKKILWL